MLMTEEEAKGKWCPKARVVHENADGAMFTAGNAFGDGCRSAATMCIGSACMAWRWTGPEREEVRNYRDAPTINRIAGRTNFHTYNGGGQYSHSDTDDDGRQFDVLHRLPCGGAPRRGFCGAFGKPEAA